jgi:hypothetical protein
MKPTEKEIMEASLNTEYPLQFIEGANWYAAQSYADQSIQESVQRRDEEIRQLVNENTVTFGSVCAVNTATILRLLSASSLSKEPDQLSILEEVKRLRDEWTEKVANISVLFDSKLRGTIINQVVDELNEIINKQQ